MRDRAGETPALPFEEAASSGSSLFFVSVSVFQLFSIYSHASASSNLRF
jgi:hypothetical protein